MRGPINRQKTPRDAKTIGISGNSVGVDVISGSGGGMGLVRRQYTVANSESCRAKLEIFGKYIVGDSKLT